LPVPLSPYIITVVLLEATFSIIFLFDLVLQVYIAVGKVFFFGNMFYPDQELVKLERFSYVVEGSGP